MAIGTRDMTRSAAAIAHSRSAISRGALAMARAGSARACMSPSITAPLASRRWFARGVSSEQDTTSAAAARAHASASTPSSTRRPSSDKGVKSHDGRAGRMCGASRPASRALARTRGCGCGLCSLRLSPRPAARSSNDATSGGGMRDPVSVGGRAPPCGGECSVCSDAAEAVPARSPKRPPRLGGVVDEGDTVPRRPPSHMARRSRRSEERAGGDGLRARGGEIDSVPEEECRCCEPSVRRPISAAAAALSPTDSATPALLRPRASDAAAITAAAASAAAAAVAEDERSSAGPDAGLPWRGNTAAAAPGVSAGRRARSALRSAGYPARLRRVARGSGLELRLLARPVAGNATSRRLRRRLRRRRGWDAGAPYWALPRFCGASAGGVAAPATRRSSTRPPAPNDAASTTPAARGAVAARRASCRGTGVVRTALEYLLAL